MAAPCVLAMVVILAAGCGSSGGRTHSETATTAKSASSLAPIHGRYSPSIHPADFVRVVDNPYWPLRPGTAFHFKGARGTTPQTDDELVTSRTEKILGIDATVVRDTVSERGRPIERTLDFYAQDRQGNVWYLGEDSFELQHGRFVKAKRLVALRGRRREARDHHAGPPSPR